MKANKKSIVEDIKRIVREAVYSDNKLKVNFSDYLADKSGYNYIYLSNVFSKSESIVLTKYIMRIKIERVKELLMQDLCLKEICSKCDFSNMPHLSNRFKKETGQTITQYKDTLHYATKELI